MKKPTETMKKTFNPRDLAGEQADAYREYIVGQLKEIAQLIEERNYSMVTPMLAFSPSGDAYGKDNYYIDFGYDSAHMDILEALNYLAYLRQYADERLPVDEAYCDGTDYIGV